MISAPETTMSDGPTIRCLDVGWKSANIGALFKGTVAVALRNLSLQIKPFCTGYISTLGAQLSRSPE